MADPCNLPLPALDAAETCPRCGCVARNHRRHRSYVAPLETVIGVDLATEPDRTVIVEQSAPEKRPALMPACCPKCSRPAAPWYEADEDQCGDASMGGDLTCRVIELEKVLAAMTERAERAESPTKELIDHAHADPATSNAELRKLLYTVDKDRDRSDAKARAAEERAEKAERELAAARFDVEAQKIRARTAEEGLFEVEQERDALLGMMPSEEEREAIHECIDAVRDSGVVGDRVHVAARAVNRLSPPSAPAHDEPIAFPPTPVLVLDPAQDGGKRCEACVRAGRAGPCIECPGSGVPYGLPATHTGGATQHWTRKPAQDALQCSACRGAVRTLINGKCVYCADTGSATCNGTGNAQR